MDESTSVKEYFSKDGTVSKWWNPTEGDYAYLFEKQLGIIKNWLRYEDVRDGLEVSCGKGRATRILSPLFESYLATDISNEMISIAQEYCPGVRFENHDAENLRIESGSQDVVVCLEALVHYPNPEVALSEFNRVLKPGGVLVTDSDNKYSLRRMIKKGYGLMSGKSKAMGNDIYRPYSRKDFVGMLNDANFDVEKFDYVGTLAPVKVHRKDGMEFRVISPGVSKKLDSIGLDYIPGVNRLATYHLVRGRKG